jgi:hypothetical protein
VLERRPEAALAALRRYDSGDQELALALLRLAAPVAEGGLARLRPEETAALLDQVDALAAALRERAPVELDRMCFCRDEVRSFGKVDRLPDDHAFQTGTDGRPGERVHVYVEVKNFACRTLPGGGTETALGGAVEVHDFRGQVVWRQDFPARPDRSLARRQDYFICFSFNVPPRLPPDASYTLWVRVKDAAGPAREAARRSLDFRVVAPGRRTAAAAGAGG